MWRFFFQHYYFLSFNSKRHFISEVVGTKNKIGILKYSYWKRIRSKHFWYLEAEKSDNTKMDIRKCLSRKIDIARLVFDLDDNDILPFSIHGIFFSDFSCLDAKMSSFWRFRFGKSHRLLNHLHILYSQRNMTFSFLITVTETSTYLRCTSFFQFYFTAPLQKMPYNLPFTKKYVDFTLSLIINLLDHLQVWCRLSRTWLLAELEVV